VGGHCSSAHFQSAIPVILSAARGLEDGIGTGWEDEQSTSLTPYENREYLNILACAGLPGLSSKMGRETSLLLAVLL